MGHIDIINNNLVKKNMTNEEKAVFLTKYLSGKKEERLKMIKEADFEYLYRYRPFTDYDKDALEKEKIWLSAFDNLNDPEECLMSVDLTPLESIRLSQSFGKKSKAQIENELNYKIQSGLKSFRKKYVVSCFTELEDDSDFWKEYADHSKGICIKYSKKDICHKIYFICPVVYKEKKDIHDYFDYRIKDKQCERVFLEKTKISRDKEKEWYREIEWRHIEKARKSRKGNYSNFKLTIAEIIIGENISKENREWVEEYCTVHNIRYRMH